MAEVRRDHYDQSRNSSASTSDWIGQLEGQPIFACDLEAILKPGTTAMGFTEGDLEVVPSKATKQLQPLKSD